MTNLPKESTCASCGKKFSTRNWKVQKCCSRSCGQSCRAWSKEQQDYLWSIADRYPLKVAWRMYQQMTYSRGWDKKSYQAIAQKMEKMICDGRHRQGYAQDWYPVRQFAEWCNLSYWAFDKMMEITDIPIRKFGQKKGARKFVRKGDLNEWLSWNKNIQVFLSFSPSIDDIEHCLNPSIFNRLKRASPTFISIRSRGDITVINEVTGQKYSSMRSAAKACFTTRTAIMRSIASGKPSRIGDRWTILKTKE
jgi:hypothetical protein